MMREKEFCIDCGIRISMPEGINRLFAKKENNPIEYKEGWKCANCYYKEVKEVNK